MECHFQVTLFILQFFIWYCLSLTINIHLTINQWLLHISTTLALSQSLYSHTPLSLYSDIPIYRCPYIPYYPPSSISLVPNPISLSLFPDIALSLCPNSNSYPYMPISLTLTLIYPYPKS